MSAENETLSRAEHLVRITPRCERCARLIEVADRAVEALEVYVHEVLGEVEAKALADDAMKALVDYRRERYP